MPYSTFLNVNYALIGNRMKRTKKIHRLALCGQTFGVPGRPTRVMGIVRLEGATQCNITLNNSPESQCDS